MLIAFIFGSAPGGDGGLRDPGSHNRRHHGGPGLRGAVRCGPGTSSEHSDRSHSGVSAFRYSRGASVAQIDTMELSQMVGRQTPILALIIPGMLVTVMAGLRRMLEVWPIIVVSGVSFAGHAVRGLELPRAGARGPSGGDRRRWWRSWPCSRSGSPREEWHFQNEPAAAERESYERPPSGATLFAWSPFIIIVAHIPIAQIAPIKSRHRAASRRDKLPDRRGQRDRAG